jgi:hypothetical protein
VSCLPVAHSFRADIGFLALSLSSSPSFDPNIGQERVKVGSLSAPSSYYPLQGLTPAVPTDPLAEYISTRPLSTRLSWSTHGNDPTRAGGAPGL